MRLIFVVSVCVFLVGVLSAVCLRGSGLQGGIVHRSLRLRVLPKHSFVGPASGVHGSPTVCVCDSHCVGYYDFLATQGAQINGSSGLVLTLGIHALLRASLGREGS